jgi:alkaline phosphatase
MGKNSQPEEQSAWGAQRRCFVKRGGLLLAGLGITACGPRVWGVGSDGELSAGGREGAVPADSEPAPSTAERESLLKSTESAPITIGLITDIHHADKPHQGTRYYRESMEKFREARQVFRDSQVDFAVELGDLIDAAPSVDEELRLLDQMQRELTQLASPWHYVLGNHCVQTLHKEEFLNATSRRKSYYSFDHRGLHFVILDACFREDFAPYGRGNFQWTDANLPERELRWLRDDLRRGAEPTVVFVHQRIDRDPPDNHTVKQSRQVRQILEESGRVVAVFQGHSHKNDYQQIRGIHYCTMRAMIEGSGAEQSGYALLDAWPDGTLRVRGVRDQATYAWPA